MPRAAVHAAARADKIARIPVPSESHITHSAEETQAFAARFAESLGPGDCIALEGELGAGKTQFVRGLVIGLGGEARAVSSPTFSLLNIYPAPRMTVFHLDAYRLAGPDDLEAIGFSELLGEVGLVVVEWASRALSLLPPRRITITLEAVEPGELAADAPAAENTRRITVHRP